MRSIPRNRCCRPTLWWWSKGEVSNDDFSGGLRLRVKRVMSMEDARTNLAESLRLKLQTQDLKGDQLRWLGESAQAPSRRLPDHHGVHQS
jgi:hypothetical protein